MDSVSSYWHAQACCCDYARGYTDMYGCTCMCCVFVAVVMLGLESQRKAWHIDHDIIAWKCATWAWYKRWKVCVLFQGVGMDTTGCKFLEQSFRGTETVCKSDYPGSCRRKVCVWVKQMVWNGLHTFDSSVLQSVMCLQSGSSCNRPILSLQWICVCVPQRGDLILAPVGQWAHILPSKQPTTQGMVTRHTILLFFSPY